MDLLHTSKTSPWTQFFLMYLSFPRQKILVIISKQSCALLVFPICFFWLSKKKKNWNSSKYPYCCGHSCSEEAAICWVSLCPSLCELPSPCRGPAWLLWQCLHIAEVTWLGGMSVSWLAGGLNSLIFTISKTEGQLSHNLLACPTATDLAPHLWSSLSIFGHLWAPLGISGHVQAQSKIGNFWYGWKNLKLVAF